MEPSFENLLGTDHFGRDILSMIMVGTQTSIAVAMVAVGIGIIFGLPLGLIAAAKRGAAIGIEGKWAIHPSQIELANKVFSPPETEVNKAKRILEELEKAANEGKGAAQLDGRMIDAASARMAENIVNIDKLINK